ncbi:MAG TPA: acyl-homoserine-lactone synthase [Bryobacteraceae bacterium]|nr:acyl-homoserine-lactone synthase [Bryobacteraceae bacterium]
MIYCVNHRTWRHFGGALASQFELRYKMLVDAQYWDVGRFQGMEYDSYDTPAATYLVWLDKDGVARGSVRTVPTDRSYMLKDLWPNIVEKIPLPQSLSVWEATRFCVDSSLPKDVRRQIKHELVCAFLEFGLKNDVREMIGVMPPKLWKSCFIEAGWDIEFLGPEKQVEGGDIIVAGLMPISLAVLQKVRATTGIAGPVLLTAREAGDDQERDRAGADPQREHDLVAGYSDPAATPTAGLPGPGRLVEVNDDNADNATSRAA